MITETGRVVSVESNSLWVETIQKSACDSCNAQKGCGQSLLAKSGGGPSAYIRVLTNGWNGEKACLHDRVAFSIPDRVIGNGSLLVYLLPLVGMMLGVLLGMKYAPAEWHTMVLAVCGFLLAAGLVRWHSHRHHNDPEYQPVLTDVFPAVGVCVEDASVVVSGDKV